MAEYEVDVVRPGVTSGVAQREYEFTDEELRKALDTLEGVRVVVGGSASDPEIVVGEVTGYEYDNGITCTIEISDDEVISKLDSDLCEIGPRMLIDFEDNGENVKATGIEFDRLFVTPEATNLVGETSRKD